MLSRSLLLLCAATQALAQSDPHPLTLDDAIRTAWANDPTIAALAFAPEAARAREVQAALRPNPEADLRGSLPLKGDSEWALGVGLSQRFPRRERSELARAYARLGVEAAALEMRDRRLRLADEVRRLWYALTVQQARWQSARRAAELPRQVLASLAPRRAAGEIPDSTWHTLELEAARAEQSALLAEAELAGGQARLRSRLRWPDGPALTPTLDLPALLQRPLPEAAALDPDLPALTLAHLSVRRAQAALALAQGETRGDWTLGAGLDFERRSNDATGRLENEPRLSASATVPWPRTGANRGNILERQAAIRIAEADLLALRENLSAQLAATLATARAARPAVLRFDALLTAAAELPAKQADAYTRGEVPLLDLTVARQQQIAVESDFLAAASRYLETLADLDSAIGAAPTQP